MILVLEGVVLLISPEVTKCLLSMWKASMTSLKVKATLVLDHISHTVMDTSYAGYRHSCVHWKPNSNEAIVFQAFYCVHFLIVITVVSFVQFKKIPTSEGIKYRINFTLSSHHYHHRLLLYYN